MTRQPIACLAFDFGAGSGRAVVAHTDGTTIETEELLRFPSAERVDGSGLRWDASMLFAQLDRGLRAAAGLSIAGIGVDTWGLDYGLIGADGALLADPHHYRDPRSQRGHDRLSLDPAWVGRETGAQVLAVNTLFQLAEEPPGQLARADRLLMMADLLNHRLTGIARNELTLARTSGLHSWGAGAWSEDILAAAGIPPHLLAPPTRPGTILGPLRGDIARRCGMQGPVVTVAGHDTASAVCALPLQADEAFVICGSWNVVGFETPEPPLNTPGFGIEGGVEGRALVLRSLDGLRRMRQLRADLAGRAGREVGFAQMQRMARQALAEPPGPASPPQRVLALYLDLVDRIAETLDDIARLRGRKTRAIRLGGGGAQDALLCQLLAARTALPVIAGPVEASATGNALMQLVGLGAVRGLTEARRLVAQGGLLTEYRPDPDLKARLKEHHACT